MRDRLISKTKIGQFTENPFNGTNLSGLTPVGDQLLVLPDKAVDFIDEDNGPAPRPMHSLGAGHDGFDVLDTAQHGTERDKLAAGGAGDDAGQSRFPDPGRAPQDHRAQLVALDLSAQRFARSKKVLLANEFGKGQRPQPIG